MNVNLFFSPNEVLGSALYLCSYLVFVWPSLHDSGSHQNLFKFAAHYHKLHIQVFAKHKVKCLFADQSIIAAAASEPEANERGSSLISRR